MEKTLLDVNLLQYGVISMEIQNNAKHDCFCRKFNSFRRKNQVFVLLTFDQMVTMSTFPAFIRLKNPKGKNLRILRLPLRVIVRFSNPEERITRNFLLLFLFSFLNSKNMAYVFQSSVKLNLFIIVIKKHSADLNATI